MAQYNGAVFFLFFAPAWLRMKIFNLMLFNDFLIPFIMPSQFYRIALCFFFFRCCSNISKRKKNGKNQTVK